MPEKQRKFVFLLAAAAGLLASLFTLRMGALFAELKLPFLFPPLWMLPVGWTAALVLTALAVRRAGQGRDGTAPARKVATAYYVSLVLAVLWAAVFFRMGARGASVVVGLLLTGVWLHLMRLLEPLSPQARRLMTPACAWAGYCSYLNLGLWLINRGI